MSQKVNLNAYFERIGFAGSIAPTLATLELLHALHPAAIAFENLNPLLGLPVKLDLASLQSKLLTERRGGYCYEHNLLLMAMLKDLDFNVRGLTARVLWNDPDTTQSHHMLLAVDINSSTYIADVGFGGLTMTAPLKLKADTEQTTPHESFRLTGGDPEWLLEAKMGEAWRPLYAFETSEKTMADFEEANRFLANDPASPMRSELRVALAPSGKRLTLKNNRLTTYVEGSEPVSQQLSSVAEMREVLTTSFGMALPPADLLDPKLAAMLAEAGIAPQAPPPADDMGPEVAEN
jgi:N-hydroxyarylamine O-acetyltransferase|tara:strand:+ start:2398 stop:3273 length:876 start_codon:yes stop_codon:yes gene_type:complete